MVPAPTYGLVLCGGDSSRMGSDKSLIAYYGKQQCYYLYDMLAPLCDKVFISCNAKQKPHYSTHYNIMTDAPKHEGLGPAAALLTAWGRYPYVNYLVAGCNYPFVKSTDLAALAAVGEEQNTGTALYNELERHYEPLVAWYPVEALKLMASLLSEGKNPLQQYFKTNRVEKVLPLHQKSIIHVDTPEAFAAVKKQMRQNA
jgi:molybdopterin-guanine dinucleotide biosynthesis protein A